MKPSHAPISQSEVSTGRGCLRKYTFQYCTDQKKRKIKSATVGLKLHKYAEDWLREGKRPESHDPVAEIFLDGLQHMPRPRTPLLIEQKWLWTQSGLPFEMTPDIADPSSGWIWDHKTSVNPQKYGLHTQADKDNDPQTIMGMAAMVACHHPVPDLLTFRHVYYRKTRAVLAMELEELRGLGESQEVLDKAFMKMTKATFKPLSIPSDGHFTYSTIRERMETVVLPIAEKLFRLRGKQDPYSIEPNAGFCGEYGGCEYLAECGPTLTAADHVRAIAKDLQNMDFITAPTALPAANGFVSPTPVNGPPASAAPQGFTAPASAPVTAPPAQLPLSFTADPHAALKQQLQAAVSAGQLTVPQAEQHLAAAMAPPVAQAPVQAVPAPSAAKPTQDQAISAFLTILAFLK